MRRLAISLILVSLMCLQSFNIPVSNLESDDTNNSYFNDQIFNGTGFNQISTYTTPDNETHVNRPEISWSIISPGLMSQRTGACSVALDSADEVWLIGGFMDPNPSQSGDETAVSLIEVYDNANNTWEPSPMILPSPQMYCEAEIIGDKIFVVGEWPRGSSNPPQISSGIVQIYNISNNTWFSGSSMLPLNERGNGGMAEAGGYLYYAGGVRNQAGNDQSNRTYRYDPVNDSWDRMADMHQPRASFELVNFHGQLYAIGGYQGTSTWNRQILTYVERYDPATNIWTNLSSLPVGHFGWGATVVNDEIILVGGNDGSPKKTVYHYNPVQDTWSKGKNIVTAGLFDIEVQEINGDVVWASGDMSTYAYSTWGQSFSDASEYHQFSGSHSGWINSPIMDLRPNIHSTATPVQITLNGTNSPGGTLGVQYRAGSSQTLVGNSEWIGSDGTKNTTYPIGINDLNLNDPANYLQYRVEMKVTDMENWDEPDLDNVSILAEHASFSTMLPQIVNPLSETLVLQTNHEVLGSGQMYVGFAPCNSLGSIIGDWSTVYFDGISNYLDDNQGMLLNAYGTLNSSANHGISIDWNLDFGELIGITHLCSKVGSNATTISQYIHSDLIEINKDLTVVIDGIETLQSGTPVTGGVPIEFNLIHLFESTNKTLSSGDIQARLSFDIRIIDSLNNQYTGWLNDTTQWYDITPGQVKKIQYNLSENVSGIVNITVESRSDQSFNMFANSNSTWLILDNEKPVMISSDPNYGSYIDTKSNREVSILVADNSGFDVSNLIVEHWIQSLDDGSDGSFPDGVPQFTEYQPINFTLENDGSLWWFNLTLSDDSNTDQEEVHVRIIGKDKVDSLLENNTIWWITRDARNGVIESFENLDDSIVWEVSRSKKWQLNISDANSISDIQEIWVEFGYDSDFGIKYDVATQICSVLDSRIDSDRSQCSHSIESDILVFEFELFANWDIDLSVLNEGEIKIRIKDIDGVALTTYQNMWTFSDEFDFQVLTIEDITGNTTGDITSSSILATNDKIRITGTIHHKFSGEDYNGDMAINWWGTLQGQSWLGGNSIQVIDGLVNTTITMPISGGNLDMSLAFLDPWSTRTIANANVGEFFIDDSPPVILQSSIETFSRYDLESVSIGVNIEENYAWTDNLTLRCKVVSTELEWPEVQIKQTPSSVFQGKTLFSFDFDFSSQGNPSLLSPEARIDCWAYGKDDSGWELVREDDAPITDVWLSFPLNDIGPNLKLKDVKINGDVKAGTKLRLDITIFNDGETLNTPFNISVYTVLDGEETLSAMHTQSEIYSGQTIVKRLSVTVPDGDWTLKVIVDEDSKIWELNEDDNTFQKDFKSSESIDSGLIIGGTIFGLSIILIFLIIRKRGDSEMTAASKSMPEIDMNNEKEHREITKPTNMKSKPKRGPPPKKNFSEIQPTNNPSITEAMAKLSLDTLPGNKQHEKAPSYESLPAGGDYEYKSEGTYYTGPDIGTWKLEEDGSFTRVE